MKIIHRSTRLLFLALVAAASLAHAQATRTWVSGVGDDVNPCSRTAPCKTFAGAISKTADGGIINVLDPGGFGAVTITKNITIDGYAMQSGVLTAGSNAIVVSGANINVILRNLSIEGSGTTPGTVGINFLNGSSLVVESCRIFGFTGGSATGIRVTNPSNANLLVKDTTIFNSGTGIHLENTGGGLLFATIDNATIGNMSGNGIETTGNWVFATVKRSTVNQSGVDGIRAQSGVNTITVVDSTIGMNSGYGVSAMVSGARIRISGNTIVNNSVGVNIASGAFVESDGTNRIAGNPVSATPNATFTNQ